jgi:hypothetical protein
MGYRPQFQHKTTRPKSRAGVRVGNGADGIMMFHLPNLGSAAPGGATGHRAPESGTIRS